MKAVPILTIPDDAKKALTGKMPERAKRVPNPRAQAAIAQAANNTIRRQLFGPKMKPTFRQRALVWTSFRALMMGHENP